MSEQSPLHDPIADAFEGFRGDALPALVPPGADAVRGTVRRRRRNRAIAAACCVAVALAGVGAAALADGRGADDRLVPADPPTASHTATPSPTPSKAPSSAPPGGSRLDLRKVTWSNASVPIPPSDGCRGGQIQFRDGKADVDGYAYRLRPAFPPAYGDIDGDGQPDALLRIGCGTSTEIPGHLVAITATGATLRGLGTISLESSAVGFTSYRVANRLVVTTVEGSVEGTTDGPVAPRETRRYRWNGSTFTQLAGGSKPPTGTPPPAPLDAASFDWLNATLRLPFRGASVRVEPNGASCPTTQVTFQNGSASAAGCGYQLNSAGMPVGDFNGDGVKDIALEISAERGRKNSWIYVYTVRRNKPVLVGFVSGAFVANPDPKLPYDVELVGFRIAGGKLVLDQFMVDGAARRTVTRAFSWNGSGFSPSQAAPHPKVDTRP